MAEKRRSSKFLTTIVIGGALGSVAAWAFGNKKRREQISEKAHDYFEYSKDKVDEVVHQEKKKSWWQRWLPLILILISITAFLLGMTVSARAEIRGELIDKETIITLEFNDNNPGGNIDLKKIVEENLSRPTDCQNPLVICSINSVNFEIVMRKEWLKIDIPELSNQEFAQTVPRIENSIDQLSDTEVVVVQETLARRGLLTHLDGSTVQERGFFGSLTNLSLVTLAHIKGLDPGDPEFNEELTDEVNKLLNNMANDDNYINNRPLPRHEDMRPGEGDSLFNLSEKYRYIAELAQQAEKVDPGPIPIKAAVGVEIDGFVNIERATE